MMPIVALLVVVAFPALAAPPQLRIDGFVDLYYAYDFNRPASKDRSYTTQPARHDEFNLNLAVLGATSTQGPLTARLALQTGTYVQRNYATEPTVGTTSGPTPSQFIQDAYLDYRISDQTTLRAGIAPSHLGHESVRSIDNLTYTRSLAADYSPYYQAGVSLAHQLSEHFSAEGLVLNGWQNVSEDDSNKAFGTALRFQRERLKIALATYHGNYQARGRQFYDFTALLELTPELRIAALFDYGLQRTQGHERRSFWTANLQARWRFRPQTALVLRLEEYRDPHEVNVTTEASLGFAVRGGSLGIDHSLGATTLLRLEHRYLAGAHRIFPRKSDASSRENHFVVVSLASSF